MVFYLYPPDLDRQPWPGKRRGGFYPTMPPEPPCVTRYVPNRPKGKFAPRDLDKDKDRIKWHVERQKKRFGNSTTKPWTTDRSKYDPAEYQKYVVGEGNFESEEEEFEELRARVKKEVRQRMVGQLKVAQKERASLERQILDHQNHEYERTKAYERKKIGVSPSIPSEYVDAEREREVKNDRERQLRSRTLKIKEHPPLNFRYKNIKFKQTQPFGEMRAKFMSTPGVMNTRKVPAIESEDKDDEQVDEDEEDEDGEDDEDETQKRQKSNSTKKTDDIVKELNMAGALHTFGTTFAQHAGIHLNDVSKKLQRTQALAVAEQQKKQFVIDLLNTYYESLGPSKSKDRKNDKATGPRTPVRPSSANQVALGSARRVSVRRSSNLNGTQSARPQSART